LAIVWPWLHHHCWANRGHILKRWRRHGSQQSAKTESQRPISPVDQSIRRN
jgi:hypothetical protein